MQGRREGDKVISHRPCAEELFEACLTKAEGNSEHIAASKVKQIDNVAKLTYDHADQDIGCFLLAEALGTTDGDFLNGLLNQLLNIGGDISDTEERLNFLLSVVKDVKPRDQLESMLAAQMAVAHMATMLFGRRLANVVNLPQQDSAINALNKLMRIFTTQLDALKRYRSGGEQKVTVQHVNVSGGGQAIVGNVTPTPKRRVTKPKRSAPALTHSQQAPMPMMNERQAEPVALKAKETNANGRKSSS